MKSQTSALLAFLGSFWFFLTSILRYFHTLARIVHSNSLLSSVYILADTFYAVVLLLFFYQILSEKKFVKVKREILFVIVALIFYLVFSILIKIPFFWQHNSFLVSFPFHKLFDLVLTASLFIFWNYYKNFKVNPLMKFITSAVMFTCILYGTYLVAHITGKILSTVYLESDILYISKPLFLALQTTYFITYMFISTKKKPIKKTKKGKK